MGKIMKYWPWVVRFSCCMAMGSATKAAGVTWHQPVFWVFFVAFFTYGTIRDYQGKGKI